MKTLILLLTLLSAQLLREIDGSKIFVAATTLYISVDDGRSWNKSSISPTECNVNFVFATESKIYATGNKYSDKQCLLISDDQGQSWDPSEGPLPKYSYSYALFVRGSEILIGTSNGLAISEDEGESWAMRTTADGLGRSSVSAVYSTGRNVYAGTNGGGLGVSTDSGKTFSIKSTAHGLADAQVNSVFGLDSKIFVGTPRGLSISLDGGQTWTTKNQTHGLGSASCGRIASVFAANNKIYATVGACDGGSSVGTLCISENEEGDDWTCKDGHDGLGKGAGRGLFVLGNEIFLTGVDTDLISFSRDNGDTWITPKNPDEQTTRSTSCVFAIE